MTTTPPGTDTVMYDGDCRFCVKAARQLRGLISADVQLVSFRDEGVLQRFPGITLEDANAALQFITADGRVYSGAEGVVRALQTRWYGKPALTYYVPGIRQLFDAVYGVIARYRFKIAGRECKDGTCHLHVT